MKFDLIVRKISNPDIWQTYIKRIKHKVNKGLSIKVWKNTFHVFSNDVIIAYWWRGRDNKNWGDKINPVLIECISGKRVMHVDDVINFRFLNVYACIGSVIEHLRYKGIHIWGSGIIRENSVIKIKPRKIYAVRGPETRKRLISEGYRCPEVYGDPAILLPMFYQPKVAKTIELGIIPHFEDKNDQNVCRLENEGIAVIDIYGDEMEFINHVCMCKRIVSSSLHGLIVADAYGIPSKWLKASDKIYGAGFKYHDYYHSIGVNGETPFILNEKTKSEELINACWKKNPNINLDELLKSCPFYQNDSFNREYRIKRISVSKV